MSEFLYGPTIKQWEYGTADPNPVSVIHSEAQGGIESYLIQVFREMTKNAPCMTYYRREGYCHGIIAPYTYIEPTQYGNLAYTRSLWFDSRNLVSQNNPHGEYKARKTRIAALMTSPEEVTRRLDGREFFDDPLSAPFVGLAGLQDQEFTKIWELTPRERVIPAFGEDRNRLLWLQLLGRKLRRIAHAKIIPSAF